MTDLLRAASEWLDAKRRAFASSPILYRRGDLSVTVPAGTGTTTFQVANESGILEDVESRDFLLSIADLDFGGGPVTPESADQIEETVGGVTLTYQVSAPAGLPPWRYTDGFRVAFRIHTKLIDQSPA